MIQSLNLELPTFAEIRRRRDEERGREERQERAARARRFEAARLNRLTRDWTTVNTSVNFELRRDLRVLRARSRALARNDDYVKRFLSMVRSNVAGPAGIKLQARARDAGGGLDRILNRAVEEAWRQWAHAENCSLSGRLSFPDATRKFVSTMARDGEALVRMCVADNPFGFALKFYSADWLDETFNQQLANGNRVIMSVEVSPDDRPVAYWLTPPASDYLFLDSRERARTRVPAEEVLHKFLADDATSDDDTQTRGVPWLHTAMKRLHILGGYEEAELVAARVSACKMGFFKPTTAAEEYTGGEDAAQERAVPLMDEAQPGQFGLLDPDMDFVEFNPDHPNANYGAFMKACLRGIAAGLDVSYFSLAGDLESVNFSTGRIGLLQERDTWQALQNFTVEHFCRPVFINWLRSSIMTGALKLRPADFYRLVEPKWLPRGWKWIDPLKEGQAHKLGIDNGWETLTDVIAETGDDIEETLDTRAHELKMLEEKGVKLVPAGGDEGDGTSPPDDRETAPEDDNGK